MIQPEAYRRIEPSAIRARLASTDDPSQPHAQALSVDLLKNPFTGLSLNLNPNPIPNLLPSLLNLERDQTMSLDLDFSPKPISTQIRDPIPNHPLTFLSVRC